MHKGMSQTLTLIVAASVLMMTAMSVIFMVQGGLGDLNQGTSSGSCRGAIDTICSGTNAVISAPSSCTQGGQKIPGAPTAVVQNDGNWEVNCQNYNG